MSKLMRDLELVEETRLSIEYAQDHAAGHVEAAAAQLARIRAKSERTLASQAEAQHARSRALEKKTPGVQPGVERDLAIAGGEIGDIRRRS